MTVYRQALNSAKIEIERRDNRNGFRFTIRRGDHPGLFVTYLSGSNLARELERDVTEGAGHTGRGAVVQVLARRF
jgi:hypothetical protein